MSAVSSDTVQRLLKSESRPSSGKDRQSGTKEVMPSVLIPMAKHSKARAGLEFVSSFFTDKQLVKATLMHIPPSQAAVWAEETSYESVDLLETQAAAADKKGRAVVEHASRLLQAAGFPAENIKEKVASPMMSKAQDIIREARTGMYDAVVLGRRVQEGLADLMDQSVCREMLEGLSDSISFPLWLCRLPEKDRKNVLLCVDGSEPSDRITDHVGFILSHASNHSVTVFHVHDPAKVDPLEAECIVNQAVELLVEAGVHPERINPVTRRGSSPARLISEEYDSGGYAAVAIGSAGSDRGFWNKLFVGSVAQTVFKDLHGAALWICF